MNIFILRERERVCVCVFELESVDAFMCIYAFVCLNACVRRASQPSHSRTALIRGALTGPSQKVNFLPRQMQINVRLSAEVRSDRPRVVGVRTRRGPGTSQDHEAQCYCKRRDGVPSVLP